MEHAPYILALFSVSQDLERILAQQQSLIRLKRRFWMSYHQHHLTDADLSHPNPPETQRWQLNISLSSQMMNTGVMDELTRNNKPVILF